MIDQSGNNIEQKLGKPLAILRITLGIFLLQWSIEKFVSPDRTVKIYQNFYHIDWLTINLSYVVGVLEMILALAEALGKEILCTGRGVPDNTPVAEGCYSRDKRGEYTYTVRNKREQ